MLTTTKGDKTGKTDQLRFPPFHTEMLDQTWINPAQDLGRIKIIIAEGIRPTPALGFEKTRNIVVFSFQHAPLCTHSSRVCSHTELRHLSYTRRHWYRLAKQWHVVSSGFAPR